MNILAGLPFQIAGYYKFEAVRLSPGGIELGRRVLADWFPNLITDWGLNAIGTMAIDHNAASNAALLFHCGVGTGTATPLVTDTQLQAYLAATTTIQSSINTHLGVSPYYQYARRTYRFGVGVATGNLSEVGVGRGTTTGAGSELFSRALILDGGGNPTTITVLADEVLDVTYEVRVYPPLVDGAGSFVLNGTTHNWISRIRSSNSNNGITGSPSITSNTNIQVFSGAIGSMTGSPSGSSSFADSGTSNHAAYVNNSLQRDVTFPFGLNVGNVGSVRSISYAGRLIYMQFEVTPVIPKDATKIMTITMREGPWSRYP